VERATLLPKSYIFDPRLAARSAAYGVSLVRRSWNLVRPPPPKLSIEFLATRGDQVERL
jgi:hypothetical protein